MGLPSWATEPCGFIVTEARSPAFSLSLFHSVPGSFARSPCPPDSYILRRSDRVLPSLDVLSRWRGAACEGAVRAPPPRAHGGLAHSLAASPARASHFSPLPACWSQSLRDPLGACPLPPSRRCPASRPQEAAAAPPSPKLPSLRGLLPSRHLTGPAPCLLRAGVVVTPSSHPGLTCPSDPLYASALRVPWQCLREAWAAAGLPVRPAWASLPPGTADEGRRAGHSPVSPYGLRAVGPVPRTVGGAEGV